jgi:hypothetical protein
MAVKKIVGYKMNCEDVKKYIDDFVAGELTANQKAKIEKHLKHCEKCRVEIEFEDSWLELLRSDKIPDPGEIYWNTLEDNILSRTVDSQIDEFTENEETESRRLLTFFRYAIPLAASIILLIVALGTNEISIYQPEFSSITYKQVVYDASILNEKPYLNINRGINKTGILCTIMTSPPGSTERHMLAGKISQEKRR